MQHPDPPRGDRPPGERPPRRLDRLPDDDEYREIPSPARAPATTNDSEDSDSGNVTIKVLAYQGGQRTQAWLASVQARMPNALSKLLDANREAQTPIDEIDAAARVVAPVEDGVEMPPEAPRPFGVFFKDYKESEW